MVRKLRSVPVRVLVVIGIALGAAGLLLLWIVCPLLQRPHVETFSSRFSQTWSLYKAVSTGAATAFLWFKSPPAIPSLTGWGVLSVTAIFLLLAFVSSGRGADVNKNVDTRTLRFCLWCLLYTIDWGIGFELSALCQRKIGRKVSDSWPTFLDWSADKPDGTAQIARVFPPQGKALYVSFVPAESVFPQALQNFDRMRVMAGNTTKTVSNVSPAIAETYQIFEKPADGVDRR
jgi:hypothetical protein